MAAKKKKAPSNAASANKEAAGVSPLPFEPV